jgi:guanylate kinase
MKVKESSLDPRFLFISPPSMDELEKRLRGRGTETEEAIKKRLGNAKKEMDYGHEAGNFDRIFVNANLNGCFEDIASAFREWYPHLDEVAPDDPPKNCTSCRIS